MTVQQMTVAEFGPLRSTGQRIQLVYNEQNSGSTFKQWNKGISLASGEYVWIAESDDVAEPTFLEKLVDCLVDHPDAGLAYCQSSTSMKRVAGGAAFVSEDGLGTQDFYLPEDSR